MKYFSELTNETYNSPEACLEAEKNYKAQQQKMQDDLKRTSANISKEKKELSKAIEVADNKLTEANKLYEAAQHKAAEILEKSNKEVKEILDAAKKEVKAAEQAKLDAVLAFNKKYGPYTTTLTGTQAAEEFNRNIKRFDNMFESLIRHLWF